MMTGHLTVVVDEATPVAGEQASVGDGVKITKWVDPVTTRHSESPEGEARSPS